MCKNLSSSTPDDSIMALLKSCGVITQFLRNKHADGLPKEFCFIEFETSAQAFKAINFNGQMLEGRLIKIELARVAAPHPVEPNSGNANKNTVN
jgi:RNA recognition motif-containing protein